MSENDNKPLVSIVMPAYNHAQYVEESVRSAMNQTYKNIELVVVDDGSKDRTREILQQLQKEYGFTLEFQENQGISKTLNRAIGLSRGKYVTTLASDDFFAPDKVEKLVDYLEAHPDCDMAFGKIYMVDKDSRIIEGQEIFKPFDKTEQEIPFETLIDNNRIPAPSTMMRRAIWNKVGGHNENTILDDFDLWLKIAWVGKIVYLDEYFAYYRWHGQNLSTHVLKIYKATWELVYSWKDKMPKAMARRILARRDSITFCILSRKYKKESLRYLKFNHRYWDSFIFQNQIKGLFKLLFCRNNNTVWK